MQNIQNLTIDINKKPFQTITANVGEVGSRYIRINIVDKSLPIDLTSVTVSIYAKKPDGNKVFNSVIVEDAKQGIILAELTSQILAVEGLVKLTLLLVKSGSKLCSKQFLLNVDSSIVDDTALESTNEFTALVDALGRVNNIDSRFENVSLQLEQNMNKINEQFNTKANEIDLEIERERINEYLQGTNENTDNAETRDIRVGKDGYVYNSAGDAVRKQFEKVTNSIKEYIDDKYNIKWIVGTVNNGMIDASYKKRISTEEIQYSNNEITIKCSDWSKYRIYIWWYDDINGTNPIGEGWKQYDYTIQQGKYYRIVFSPIFENEVIINTPYTSIFENIYLYKSEGLYDLRLINSNFLLNFQGEKITINTYSKKITIKANSIMFGKNFYKELKNDLIIDYSINVGSRIKVILYNAISEDIQVIAYSNYKKYLAKNIHIIAILFDNDNLQINMNATYEIDGFNKYNTIKRINNNKVLSIAHMGGNGGPENTLRAFEIARNKGYKWVECDVRYCADDIVMIHDNTIDRTSNGTGKVNTYTLEQLKEFDFGNDDYPNTKISSVNELLQFLKINDMNCFLEAKDTLTTNGWKSIYDKVKRLKLQNNIVYCSAIEQAINNVVSVCENSNYGFVSYAFNDDIKSKLLSWKVNSNKLFLLLDYNVIKNDNSIQEWCFNNDIELIAFTVDNINDYYSAVKYNYIDGVISNTLHIADIF